ncbi:ABC transporter substrate-binding protein [Bacillus wiedmannii]|uniref:ABC transporter substrate-binding protein n=1 Tax=Bacillus wiedmannii TaxID=1890302 RepID=UPI002E1E4142|nr:ABC transporter substrate-binding protein [Bacillus wiedmannii]
MKIRKVMVVLTIILSIMVGCGKNNNIVKEDAKNIGNYKIIKHAFGDTKVKEFPNRVVVLELGFIDPLVEMGIKPVGVADDKKPQLINQKILKEIEGYKSVGRRAEPSLEMLKNIKPDLIIADASRHKNAYAELSKIAPTIALKNVNASYQDTIDATLTIGDAVGKVEQAKNIVKKHKEKVQQIKSKTTGTTPSILLMAERDGIFNTRTLQFFTPGLLEALGYKYALPDKSGDYSVKMTLDQLVQIDPEMIVLMKTVAGESSVAKLNKNSLWKNLRAVKNSRVYEVDVTSWSLRRSLEGANQIIDEAGSLFFNFDK